MNVIYFTVVAIGLYFAADALLDWIERKRGARFANRQIVFFAIMLALALPTFWIIRTLSAAPR